MFDGQGANRLAQDFRVALRGVHQLHEQLQGCRLAGAIGTEEPEDFAGFDVEREMVEGAVQPLAPEADCVVLCQLVRGKGWHVTSSWRSAARWRSPARRYCGGNAPSTFTPLMKNVGVDLIPS